MRRVIRPGRVILVAGITLFTAVLSVAATRDLQSRSVPQPVNRLPG